VELGLRLVNCRLFCTPCMPHSTLSLPLSSSSSFFPLPFPPPPLDALQFVDYPAGKPTGFVRFGEAEEAKKAAEAPLSINGNSLTCRVLEGQCARTVLHLLHVLVQYCTASTVL